MRASPSTRGSNPALRPKLMELCYVSTEFQEICDLNLQQSSGLTAASDVSLAVEPHARFSTVISASNSAIALHCPSTASSPPSAPFSSNRSHHQANGQSGAVWSLDRGLGSASALPCCPRNSASRNSGGRAICQWTHPAEPSEVRPLL